MTITVTAYSDAFVVTRAELDETRRTAYPMRGVAHMAKMRRDFEIADQLEAEHRRAIERDAKARAEYPAKLAAWQTQRAKRCADIEANITRGVRYTADELRRLVADIWSTKPEEPR
jgi:transketolase